MSEAPVHVLGLDDPAITSRIDADIYARVRADLSMLEGAGAEFDRARVTCYDVLLVDGYDRSGLPEALSSQRFCDDWAAALTAQGLLAINPMPTAQGAREPHLFRPNRTPARRDPTAPSASPADPERACVTDPPYSVLPTALSRRNR